MYFNDKIHKVMSKCITSYYFNSISHQMVHLSMIHHLSKILELHRLSRRDDGLVQMKYDQPLQ